MCSITKLVEIGIRRWAISTWPESVQIEFKIDGNLSAGCPRDFSAEFHAEVFLLRYFHQ